MRLRRSAACCAPPTRTATDTCGTWLSVVCVAARSPERSGRTSTSTWAPLRIARSRVQVGAATVVENEPKTQSSRRTLPLDEGLIGVLKRASSRYAQGKTGPGCSPRRQRLRCVQRGWGAVHAGRVDEHVAPFDGGGRGAPIRLHDARHSCGTVLHLRGVPMAVIAKWLGHADASITARIYAHSQDEALRSAGATLGQVVTPAG